MYKTVIHSCNTNWKKIRLLINWCEFPARKWASLKSSWEEDSLCFLSIYIAPSESRRTLWAATRRGPQKALQGFFSMERCWSLGLCPPVGPDSHLLQRLTHFNPLSLDSRFSRPSGHIHIAAQLAHLIVAGGICVHKEKEGQLVWFKPTTNWTYWHSEWDFSSAMLDQSEFSCHNEQPHLECNYMWLIPKK